jgi:2-dehydropantoate 2-reductase
VTVAVLGPGGVGGLIAAALARAGSDVVVVARGDSAEAIARDGIAVSSVVLGDFGARPRAPARLDEPVDALLVATKATGLEAALDRVDATPGLVVPLLNGLDHFAVLRERFPDRVAAGTILVESTRTAPGRIDQTSRFLQVELAADDERLRAPLEALRALLDGAGIPARIGESEAQVVWSKLVRLNALACATAAYGVPLGSILADPDRRSKLEAAVAETAAVARAEGAEVDPDAALAELHEAHPELVSSLARDVAAGRDSELDAIPGSVLRAAARHGLECPTVAELAELVRARQSAGAAGASP